MDCQKRSLLLHILLFYLRTLLSPMSIMLFYVRYNDLTLFFVGYQNFLDSKVKAWYVLFNMAPASVYPFGGMSCRGFLFVVTKSYDGGTNHLPLVTSSQKFVISELSSSLTSYTSSDSIFSKSSFHSSGTLKIK